ncbi:MAG: hypothetical protein ABI623_04470 [bacterium]
MAETLKKAALGAIAKLPDTATLDDIMYRLYVIEKVRKGQDAVKLGQTISIEEMKKEVSSW